MILKIKFSIGVLSALLLLLIVFVWFSYEDNNIKPIPSDQSAHPSPSAPVVTERGKKILTSDHFVMDDFWETLIAFDQSQDFSLTFTNSHAMNGFLSSLDRNGFRLRASLPQILTCQFQILNPRKAAVFLRDFNDVSGVEINRKIYRPRQPSSLVEDVGVPAFQNIDSWMGIATNRSSWGNGIKVAILDSGVDFTHPSLSGLEYEVFSFLPESAKNELDFHGTAIASIIAGNSESFQGLAPASKILSIEVLDGDGAGDVFSVAQGIVKAVDEGAHVVNLSLGGDMPSTILKKAIEYAVESGVIVVAASGNDGLNEVSFPARYDEVIGVGALGQNGRIADFSNYGEGLDITAPGVNVLSAVSDSEYGLFGGTSSATAFVTGSIAVEMSHSGILPLEEVKRLLFDFANEVNTPGFDLYSGHGALNLARIVNRNAIDYHDAAIVGYHFPSSHSGMKEWTTIPFEVVVQNQGSTWINNLKLTVEYKGLRKDFLFSNLHPGQSRSERLFLDGSSVKNGIEVTSFLELGDKKDINPLNNFRKSRIVFPGEDK